MKHKYVFTRLILAFVGLWMTQMAFPQKEFWEQTNGPYTATVNSIIVNVSDHIFIRTNNGVYRSADNGNTWKQTNVGLDNRFVYSLFLHPSGYLFAGTDQGLFRSKNNGDTWAMLDLPQSPFGSFAIDSSGHIYVTTGGNTYYSASNGDSWTRTEYNRAIFAIPSHGYLFTVHFGSEPEDGVYRSSDNGSTWKEICPNCGSCYSFIINQEGHLFIGGYGEIYRSTDDGDSWGSTRFNTGNDRYDVISLATRQNGEMLAGTRGGQVYRSTDYGVTWTLVRQDMMKSAAKALAFNSSGHIFIGTEGCGVFRSTDHGATWIQVNTGLTNAYVRSLAVKPNGHVFAGLEGGGIHRSEDKGKTWVLVNTGLTNSIFSSVAIHPNGSLFAAGGGIFRSTDEGETWMPLKVDSNDICGNSVVIDAEGRIFVGCPYSSVIRSTDNGETWQTIRIDYSPTMDLSISPKGDIFVGCARSSDHGETWTAMNRCILPNAFNSRGRLFASFKYTSYNDYYPLIGLYRSIDNGDFWTQIQTSPLALLGINSTDHMFAMFDSRVFRSIDEGSSWMPIGSSPFPHSDITASTIDPEGYLYVGTRNAVYRSTRSINPLPPAWSFTANTGISATITIPAGVTPTIDNRSLCTGDAIGVFFELNDSLICAGYGIWQEGQDLEFTAWGDCPQTSQKEGFSEGEILHFKLWRPVARQDFPAKVTYQSSDTVYVGNGTYVLSSLSASSITAQHIALQPGWNMISSYLVPNDSSLAKMLGEIEPNLQIVKDGIGHLYWPAYQLNSIGNWNFRHSYQIYVQGGDTLTVKGTDVLPEARFVPLSQGWNMIAYLRDQDLPIEAVLSGTVSNLVIAINNHGGVYWPAFSIDTIGSMKPGQGYKLYLRQATTLFYASCNEGLLKVSDDEPQRLPAPQHYQVPFVNTGACAVLLLHASDWSDGDEIAALTSTGQIAGSRVVTQGKALLTIWGDDEITKDRIEGMREGEVIALSAWSKEEQKEIPVELSSLNDALTGLRIETNLLYRNDAVWVAELAGSNELPTVFALQQNYPNPFNSSTVIRYSLPHDAKVTLRVYSALGQQVAVLVNGQQKAGSHQVTFSNAGLASGVYLYSLQAGDFTTTKKLIILQ